jgi:hypothetical protein
MNDFSTRDHQRVTRTASRRSEAASNVDRPLLRWQSFVGRNGNDELVGRWVA